MGFTASMARRVAAMKNSATTEIEKYILQCAYQGYNIIHIVNNAGTLYESAINSYEKLLDMGYKVDKYQYDDNSGINSIVIYWGSN